MAFRINRARVRCFAYDLSFVINQTTPMNRLRDESIELENIAIHRRESRGLPSLDVEENSRTYYNCIRSIREELAIITADPNHTRLNVLIQTHG